MQINDPMNLSNLMNPDPKPETTPSPRRSNGFTCVNTSPYQPEHSENNFREVCSLPSPPASDYSPEQGYQQIESSASSPIARQLHSPPIEKNELAFRPRQNDDSHRYYSDHHLQNRYQQHIQLPSISTLNIQLDLRSTQPQTSRHLSYEDYPRLDSCRQHLKPQSKTLRQHLSRERSIPSTNTIRKPNQRRPPKKKNGPHSNAKYTDEQVDFIRYFKNDHTNSYAQIQDMFHLQFPGGEKRDSDQCFSSRTYRDHLVPILAENWNLTFDSHGKVLVKKAPIRQKDMPEFAMVPVKLVERKPHRALEYPWVAPCHKEGALEIIEQDKREMALGCLSEPAQWRLLLALMENMEKHDVKLDKLET